MSAWSALFMKELRMNRKFFCGALIMILLLALVVGGFILYQPYGIISIVFAACTSVLILYVLAYTISSMVNEKNSESIWMQTPLPGWSMLIAKLAAGLVSMILTSIVVVILAQVLLMLDGSFSFVGLFEVEGVYLSEEDKADFLFGEQAVHFIKDHYVELALRYTPLLLGSALLLASWYLIYYTTAKTLQRWIGRWSILAGIVAVYVAIRCYNWIHTSPVGDWFKWGVIRISDAQFMVGNHKAEFFMESVSVGMLLFDLIIVGLVVLLSGWLLDKKVEVR